jgi:L-threonylcarbamoyladenylate synthase
VQAITGTDINIAAEWLQKGLPVAIPTETVYGLAANAFNEQAIIKVFEAKARPFFDPLIVHISKYDNPEKYVTHMPEMAIKLAKHFWPGPLTLILTKKDIVPDLVSSGQNTVGIRMPDHPLTQQLLSILPFPLAAPSANPFGYISPTTAQHVFDQLGKKIPYILDGGACKVGLESTIIGFENDIPVVYRLGGTALEEIEEITGSIELWLNQSSNPRAPGQLKSHYAPKKRVIVGDIPQLLQKFNDKKIAVILFSKSLELKSNIQLWTLSKKGDLAEAAVNLFKALREADQSDADIIIAEVFPEKGLGRAINDRLRRAASVEEGL